MVCSGKADGDNVSEARLAADKPHSAQSIRAGRRELPEQGAALDGLGPTLEARPAW